MQTEPQCGFNFIPIKLAKIEKSDKVNYQQICGEKGTFKMMLVGINIGANILENSIKLTYRVESNPAITIMDKRKSNHSHMSIRNMFNNVQSKFYCNSGKNRIVNEIHVY